jgi:hypothetical protein
MGSTFSEMKSARRILKFYVAHVGHIRSRNGDWRLYLIENSIALVMIVVLVDGIGGQTDEKPMGECAYYAAMVWPPVIASTSPVT